MSRKSTAASLLLAASVGAIGGIATERGRGPCPSLMEMASCLQQQGITSWGCDPWPAAEYQWAMPDSGSPVVLWLIESHDTWRIPAAGPLETSCRLPFAYPAYLGSRTVRVAGIDAQGRIGPVSEWSDPFWR